MKTNIYLLSTLAQFCLACEIFQTNLLEGIKTHILCSVTFLLKSLRLLRNVEIYGTAGQTMTIKSGT
jgi:hypothetical protein